jgi:hypothetical protein
VRRKRKSAAWLFLLLLFAALIRWTFCYLNKFGQVD